MKKFYFTFGSAHELEDGTPLASRYCEVEAESEHEAIEKFQAVRGTRYSYCYADKVTAGVNRWNLNPIELSKMTKQPFR